MSRVILEHTHKKTYKSKIIKNEQHPEVFLQNFINSWNTKYLKIMFMSLQTVFNYTLSPLDGGIY